MPIYEAKTIPATTSTRRRRPSYPHTPPQPPATPASRAAAQKTFFRQLALFADLPDAELEALSTDFVPCQFRHGEPIFYQGDPGQMFYLIQSGQVRIYVQGEEGQETSVILYGPGDIFGELAVIDGLPAPPAPSPWKIPSSTPSAATASANICAAHPS